MTDSVTESVTDGAADVAGLLRVVQAPLRVLARVVGRALDAL